MGGLGRSSTALLDFALVVGSSFSRWPLLVKSLVAVVTAVGERGGESEGQVALAPRGDGFSDSTGVGVPLFVGGTWQDDAYSINRVNKKNKQESKIESNR
jgi:hypothetical protein